MSLLLWSEDIVEDCRGEKYTLKYIQFLGASEKNIKQQAFWESQSFSVTEQKTDSNSSKVFKGICEILLEIKDKLIQFQGLHYIWH